MTDKLNTGEDVSAGPTMSERITSLDWRETPVGPFDEWPHSLRGTIKTILGSRYPMILLWGESLIQIYNDAYTNLIGDKHPYALGKSIRETQAESWEIIGPMIRHVMSTGTPNWVPAQMLALTRFGYVEETYFSLSYSAVEDDNNVITGMLCVCSEVTQQVLGERRLRLQRDLASKAGETRSIDKVCHDIMTAIEDYRSDVPFMRLYLSDIHGDIKLKRSIGLNEPIKTTIDPDTLFPLQKAFAGETIVTGGFRDLLLSAGGPWSQRVNDVISIPIPSATHGSPLGVIVAGVNPNCALDENYRSFFELLTGQISVALRNALAHEEERKRAEALAELDRAKTTFFSNVSHEFRTPLTLMLGPLEELLSESASSLSEEDRDQLTLVYQNSLRLLKLVNSLLDFSRIESNRTEATYRAIDLSLFTKELASSFESAVQKAGLKYDVNCNSLSERIYVDQGMWEKIILNLLSNALKFTFGGFISIKLTESETQAVLIVQDSGIGIPQEDLQNIFKRFHRVHNSRSRSFEGTGIGLALVKELVELHHGNIAVQSTPGEGTTFTVSIPKGYSHFDLSNVVTQNPAESADTKTLHQASYINEASLWLETGNQNEDISDKHLASQKNDNVTVLLVDDNAQMLQYLKRLLGVLWRIETAKDGVEALSVIRSKKPDLVLSDVMMPNMNGFELLSAIRADETLRTIPVILLSARAGQEATIEGLEKGANDYLVKPFYARELIARLKAQLEISMTRNDNVLLEQRVRARTSELQRINEELEQFAHVASHDLQEPLRKIRTFAGMLENASAPGTGDSLLFLKKISGSAERMSTLITGLLNFSRLSEKASAFEATDLNKVFEDVEKDFELVIVQKNAVITRTTLPTIEAIPLQMNQLIYNLIGNALKFTVKGRDPQILVSSTLMTAQEIGAQETLIPTKKYFKIEFEDNGVGFDNQYVDQVFAMFKRLNAASEYAGSGIGLALCKRIVLNHGGLITATSQKDKGSIFTVILPGHLAS